MTIKEFVEKAIEGGWKPSTRGFNYKTFSQGAGRAFLTSQGFEVVALDPKSWQAVGKVEGWGKPLPVNGLAGASLVALVSELSDPSWQNRMHIMIDHLIDGGTIESYLETL